MPSDWGQEAWAKSVESPEAKPMYREKYSVPYAAKNPDTIQDCEFVTEDLTAMILDPPVQGRSQVLTEPGSLDTSCGDITRSVVLRGNGHPDNSQGSLCSGRSQMASLIKILQPG